MNSIKKNKRLLLERIVIALCIIFCLESGSVIYFFTVGGGSLQKNLAGRGYSKGGSPFSPCIHR